ncbi:MAG: TRAP transporter substrate-binding protein [Oscillospiraceae bacterium]|nr:TRAP transporter substrate-binding protein [Oscillospiraceae bacterium]
MKKRILSFVLAMAMVFSLAACGGNAASSSGNNQPASSSGTSQPAASGSTNATAAPDAVKYNWTVSSGLAVGSSWDLGLLKLAELLSERSDGAITLTVHSGGTLGSAKECLEGVQMGSIDFIVESSASLSNFTDAMSVFDLPYLFPNAEVARKALEGDAAKGQLDALESIGLKGINYWENGIYAIGCTKPINSLAELKGLRVRSIDSALQADVYGALGAMPVVLSWGDIYTSLQQGVVDAVSSTTVPNMFTANFYEVAPYITLSNQGYSPAPFICNLKLWQSLPADIQDLVVSCAEEARAYHYEVCNEQMADFRTQMEQKGTTFIEVDTTDWQAAVQSVYDKYVGADGIDPALVDAVKADVAAAQ